MTDEKMGRAFDEAYPKGKPSFNALRVDNLVDEIKSYQHQIKVLSDRHNKDVETIEKADDELFKLKDAAARNEKKFSKSLVIIASQSALIAQLKKLRHVDSPTGEQG